MATAPQALSDSVANERIKFRYLFFVLLALLLFFPTLERPGLSAALFRLLGTLAFLATVYVVSERRAQWITALALALPAGILHVLFALRPDLPLAVATLVCTLLFIGFTLVSVLRAVLRSSSVTLDTIYGAISVYLLMAILWAVAYLLLETLQPGSLSLDISRHPHSTVDWFDCLFYSFVTLTTTGYGDIVPISTAIRSLSMLEVVAGTMYIAVLIARLVGLYAAKNSQARI